MHYYYEYHPHSRVCSSPSYCLLNGATNIWYRISCLSNMLTNWQSGLIIIKYYSTSHSSIERSIPPIFTNCVISFLFWPSEYCSAFSFESNTLSTLLACSSSTLAMTTHIFMVNYPLFSVCIVDCWYPNMSFPSITILYPINSSYQLCLEIITVYD